MIPSIVLISTIVFAGPFECIQHMDNAIVGRPENTNVTYAGMKFAALELFGAHAFLKCDGNLYTVNLLTERYLCQ